MANDHAYSNLQLFGDFSDDGEVFHVGVTLNGVDLRLWNVYVADFREKFDEARQTVAAPADDSAS